MYLHLPLFLQLKIYTMDVSHYFEAIDFSEYHDSSFSQWKFSLGESIEKNTVKLNDRNIHELDIALIGVPFDSRTETSESDAPNKIRKELYRLSKLGAKTNIADFGNLKPASTLKGNYKALRDVIDFFNELEIVSIVIGGSQDLTIGICEVFQSDQFFSLSTVDTFLDIKKGRETLTSTNYLTRIFNNQPELFQFNLLGYQSHYTSPELFSKAIGINQNIRLGLLRDDITLAEPVLRNTDVLSFDIGAIKYSEAPGSSTFSPNGLRSEEACQLAKYAGISNRLKTFGLFELNFKNDKNDLTVKLSAQIIWYFLEGFMNRIPENPGMNENYTIYQVEVNNVDKPIVFLKNISANRWWFQIPVLNADPIYFGCSEKEYELASINEIPEMWLKYLQKSDEILK